MLWIISEKLYHLKKKFFVTILNQYLAQLTSCRCCETGSACCLVCSSFCVLSGFPISPPLPLSETITSTGVLDGQRARRGSNAPSVSVLCCRMRPEAPCSQLRSRRLPREVRHHSQAICRSAATGKLRGPYVSTSCSSCLMMCWVSRINLLPGHYMHWILLNFIDLTFTWKVDLLRNVSTALGRQCLQAICNEKAASHCLLVTCINGGF
jgi:hypothetical protein